MRKSTSILKVLFKTNRVLFVPILLAFSQPLFSQPLLAEIEALKDIDVELYGNLHVSVERVENAFIGENRVDVNSNGSKFGLRGGAPLEKGMQVFYQLEWDVDLDGDNASSHPNLIVTHPDPDPANTETAATEETVAVDFEQDDTFKAGPQYLGIKTKAITVSVGRNDTPLHTSQRDADLFDDTSVDIATLIGGEVTPKNTILFTTPKIFKYMTLNYMLIPGEGNEPDNGAVEASSSSIILEVNNVYVAAGFDNQMPGELEPYKNKVWNGDDLLWDRKRLTVSTTIAEVKVNVMAQESEFDDADISSFGMISAQYTRDKNTYKVQLSELRYKEVEDVYPDLKDSQDSVGIERSLAAKTDAYATLTQRNFDSPILEETSKGKVFSLGLKHQF